MLTREDVIDCLKTALAEAERNGLAYKVTKPEGILDVAVFRIKRRALEIEREKRFVS